MELFYIKTAKFSRHSLVLHYAGPDFRQDYTFSQKKYEENIKNLIIPMLEYNKFASYNCAIMASIYPYLSQMIGNVNMNLNYARIQ